MAPSSTRAMPAMPTALGCSGKVPGDGTMGSTHRLVADVQALWAALGVAMLTKPSPAAEASPDNVSFRSASMLRT